MDHPPAGSERCNLEQIHLSTLCFENVDFCSLKKDGEIIISERQTKIGLLGRSDT